MSESAEKTSTFGNTLPHAGIHQGSSSDDPTEADPTTITPSQMILLEALQNFVVPLIHVAGGEKKKDVGQVHSMGPEAGKLLAALQEFVSSMIKRPQVGQSQGIEVDLNDAMVKSSAVATESKVSDPGPSKALIPRHKDYHRFMRRLQEAVREHVFSKMPIRLLHFTNTPRDPGTKLRITLLERNDFYGRILQEIQASYSERMFEERMEMIYWQEMGPELEKTSIEDDIIEVEDDIIEKIVQKNTKYAILSHTWLRGSDSEVTYVTWQTGQFETQQPGYQKLANFCKSTYKDHQFSFGWMDTVCINKDSSSELDESIRSMYKWYENSAVCITYLAGTIALDKIYHDPWFTRGWTFQELLAPACMTFYNKDWKKFVPYMHLGDKHNPDIIDQISKAMKITENELHSPTKLSISRKMQLAAKRNVMREEDTAYSLMGICNVSISIAYGEGTERAFFRLMTEVLNTSSEVVDIFNCAQWDRSSIIPSGPSAYLRCFKDFYIPQMPPIEPLLLTHVGLRMLILLMPSVQEGDPCLKNNPIGRFYATLQLNLRGTENKTHHLLDKGIKNLQKKNRGSRYIYGILNFGGDTTSVHILDFCLAICFKVVSQTPMDWSSTLGSSRIRIPTNKPIVFHLEKEGVSSSGRGHQVYSIPRSELEEHGMTLTTMYL